MYIYIITNYFELIEMKDSGSKKIPVNQLQYLTNSQSSGTAVNNSGQLSNYESSSTPTKIKGLLNTSSNCFW